jgi:hypothetical protein
VETEGFEFHDLGVWDVQEAFIPEAWQGASCSGEAS